MGKSILLRASLGMTGGMAAAQIFCFAMQHMEKVCPNCASGAAYLEGAALGLFIAFVSK